MMRDQTKKTSTTARTERPTPFSQGVAPALGEIATPSLASHSASVLQMQRMIGNQASLRLLRKPAVTSIPIQHKVSKGYVKRAVIQRHIMPYDTWKDYSDGGTFRLRPDELKTVDGILKTYDQLAAVDQPAALRLVVVNLKKYRTDNGGAGSKEWKKNKRSEAVDTLIAQIEETQAMQGQGLQTVQLWSVEQFTKRTEDDGKYFGKAGQSGFQKEIIKRLTEFHALKDPTGVDLDKSLALLYQMRDMAGYWTDQNQGNNNRQKRMQGMTDFTTELQTAIQTLEGYLGGQIQGHQGKIQVAQGGLSGVVPQGGKSEQQQQQERIAQIKITHEGGAESLFKKLGALISDHPGTKTEVNVEVKFPVGKGLFLGAHLKVTAESEIELSAKDGAQVKTPYTKVHSDLTATFGWEIPKIVELKAEVGGYLEARGETPKDAMLLLSYAFYRRLMDAKYGSSATRKVAGSIWGGYTGRSGVKMAELWGKKVEKTALDKDIAYAESGGTVIGGAKVGSKATVVDMGLKYQYFNGRKYTKKTVAAGNNALAQNQKARFDEDNQWHEVKFEVGLAGIFRAELKAKIPTRTADQTKSAQKKQISEAQTKAATATTKKQQAQALVNTAQTDYDTTYQQINDLINANDPIGANALARSIPQLEKDLEAAKEKLQWWTDYEAEQLAIANTPEKDQSLPRNFELEGFTVFLVGGTGWGAILEGLLSELGMKLIELMRKTTGITGDRGPDLLPTPSEWLSHAVAFDNYNDAAKNTAGYGIPGKDGIKSGSLTGETGSSPKDTALAQSGFSLTLSCKVKEGVATWLVSVERATEAGINVGVFKADVKQKRRIFGFTIKKLATGDKDLSGTRTQKTNFALV